eukprot:1665710-Alexandrium_andersonii.AAC.1
MCIRDRCKAVQSSARHRKASHRKAALVSAKQGKAPHSTAHQRKAVQSSEWHRKVWHRKALQGNTQQRAPVQG